MLHRVYVIKAQNTPSRCDYRVDTAWPVKHEIVVAIYEVDWRGGGMPFRVNLGPQVLSQLDIAISCLLQQFPGAKFVGTEEEHGLLRWAMRNCLNRD